MAYNQIPFDNYDAILAAATDLKDRGMDREAALEVLEARVSTPRFKRKRSERSGNIGAALDSVFSAANDTPEESETHEEDPVSDIRYDDAAGILARARELAAEDGATRDSVRTQLQAAMPCAELTAEGAARRETRNENITAALGVVFAEAEDADGTGDEDSAVAEAESPEMEAPAAPAPVAPAPVAPAPVAPAPVAPAPVAPAFVAPAAPLSAPVFGGGAPAAAPAASGGDDDTSALAEQLERLADRFNERLAPQAERLEHMVDTRRRRGKRVPSSVEEALAQYSSGALESLAANVDEQRQRLSAVGGPDAATCRRFLATHSRKADAAARALNDAEGELRKFHFPTGTFVRVAVALALVVVGWWGISTYVINKPEESPVAEKTASVAPAAENAKSAAEEGDSQEPQVDTRVSEERDRGYRDQLDDVELALSSLETDVRAAKARLRGWNSDPELQAKVPTDPKLHTEYGNLVAFALSESSDFRAQQLKLDEVRNGLTRNRKYDPVEVMRPSIQVSQWIEEKVRELAAFNARCGALERQARALPMPSTPVVAAGTTVPAPKTAAEIEAERKAEAARLEAERRKAQRDAAQLEADAKTLAEFRWLTSQKAFILDGSNGREFRQRWRFQLPPLTSEGDIKVDPLLPEQLFKDHLTGQIELASSLFGPSTDGDRGAAAVLQEWAKNPIRPENRQVEIPDNEAIARFREFRYVFIPWYRHAMLDMTEAARVHNSPEFGRVPELVTSRNRTGFPVEPDYLARWKELEQWFAKLDPARISDLEGHATFGKEMTRRNEELAKRLSGN